MSYTLKLVDQGIFNRYVEEHNLQPQPDSEAALIEVYSIKYLQDPSSYKVLADKAPKAQKYSVRGTLLYYINYET